MSSEAERIGCFKLIGYTSVLFLIPLVVFFDVRYLGPWVACYLNICSCTVDFDHPRDTCPPVAGFIITVIMLVGIWLGYGVVILVKWSYHRCSQQNLGVLSPIESEQLFYAQNPYAPRIPRIPENEYVSISV